MVGAWLGLKAFGPSFSLAHGEAGRERTRLTECCLLEGRLGRKPSPWKQLGAVTSGDVPCRHNSEHRCGCLGLVRVCRLIRHKEALQLVLCEMTRKIPTEKTKGLRGALHIGRGGEGVEGG